MSRRVQVRATATPTTDKEAMPALGSSLLTVDRSTLDSSDRAYLDNLARAYFGKLVPIPEDEAPAEPVCPACPDGYGWVRRAPHAKPGDKDFGIVKPCPVCREPGIEQRALAKALKNASVPGPFLDCDFDSYRAIPEADTEACDYVEDWTRRVLENPKAAKSIMLLGVIGTGKTGCGAAAFRILLREQFRIAAFIRTVDLFKQLGRAIDISKAGGDPSVSVAEIVDRCSEAELFMLDDVGAEKATDYREEKLYEILGARHAEQRTTIITSNKGLDELREQVGPRTYSRLVEMCAPNILEFQCPDLRLAMAERLMGR